jgi:RNA polymerase sigma-70 factor (ECF subfamily)
VGGSMVDDELLAACRRGDRGAFEEVVRKTYQHVYTQALRLVGDRQEAEDVAQEAYTRVFRSLSGFRGEAQFDTWLYRIVANAALTHLRKRRRFGDLMREEDPEPSLHSNLTGPEERALDRHSLDGALDALPATMRTVVILKDIYGLSCREIGEELGVSEGAVKVRLHRARRRLKEALFGGGGRDEL